MACKMPVRCPHCDVVMTWHKAIGKIMCHFCGQESPVPKECPSCGTPGLAPMGAGTQRIEEEINTLFPDARTLRIDMDTTRGRYGFLDLWKKIEGGGADILLGTQMIAKGLHLERVTLVGVVSADHALFLPDFRAAERAFSQLTQVAGRAGRMQQQGQVIVQTFVPHHYAIQRAIAHDMDGFLRQELHMRSVLRFPPLWKLLLVRFTGADPEHVAARAQRLGALLRAAQERTRDFRPLSVLGPAPCPIARLKDKTRWQILIRGQESALMRRWLLGSLAALEKEKGAAGVDVTIDMDPCDVL
jgi:primosomal protein N' (replication factor Y)